MFILKQCKICGRLPLYTFFLFENLVKFLVLEGIPCWKSSASAHIFAPVVAYQQKVFVSTNNGVLLVLCILTGNPVVSIDLGIGPLSPRGIHVRLKNHHRNMFDRSSCPFVCVLCSTSGSLMALEVNFGNDCACKILGSTRLNTEVFSGLITFGDLAFLGARDESVHCVHIGALAG